MPSARIILMYHRIASVSGNTDPLQLCVDPARFREQVAVVSSLGEIVPLEAIARGDRRHTGVRFAITFDDGYADNALAAAPVLESFDVPATVFVVAGAVGSARAFWWDRLASLVFQDGAPSRVELTLDGKTVAVDARSAEGRMRAYWTAWSRLRVLPSSQIEEALEQLGGTLGAAPDPPGARPLTEAELHALASGDVQIGAHTLSHPSLSASPDHEQRREIVGSRVLLEELAERPVSAFAYPYGDYDERAVRAVRRGGFRAACTVHEGRVSAISSRWRLPRHAVRDWGAEELELRLRGWLGDDRRLR